MERVNAILNHELYKSCLSQIQVWESTRVFCGHDMTHFLDVARLAYLFNLEQNLKIEKDIIYAAAVLHDIGRHIQYEDGTPHQKASLPIAENILIDTGFSKKEREEILRAIENHRNPEIGKKSDLSGILYRADKMSRSCFACQVQKECNWSLEKKNMEIQY